MQGRQQLLYRGTFVVLERLSSVFGDDSVSQETLPTVLEVVGHLWPLLPMIAISSCSTYVTCVWLQQQPGDTMVFIHRLSDIGWDKTYLKSRGPGFPYSIRRSVILRPSHEQHRLGLVTRNPSRQRIREVSPRYFWTSYVTKPINKTSYARRHYNSTKGQMLRLVQPESICRRQNKCNYKTVIRSLVTSIFSFAKNFFKRSFSLTLSQTTNFRLFQTERIADNNFKLLKMAKSYPNR